MSLALEPYTRARQPGVQALMQVVWGTAATSDEFDWWFEDGPEGHAVITVAVDGEEVVGVAAMAWMRLRIDGEEIRVPVPQFVATHPEYRGQGIFQRLELESERRAVEQGADLALTFPNAATAPVFLGALGWTALKGPRVWIRPLRPLALGRALLRRPVGTPGSWPMGQAELAGNEGIHVRRLDAAPPGIDELVGTSDRSVTDAEFLEWRYLRSPREYRCFGVFDRDGSRGFAAVAKTTLHGVTGVSVAELIVADGDAAAARALLAAGVEEANGFSCMFAADPHPALRTAFVRSGFLPTPRRLRLLGKRLSGSGSPPSPPVFVLGDLDFV